MMTVIKEYINQTTDTMKDIQFRDIFNLAEIQHLQDMFADVHGVASIITDAEGVPITNPSKFCRLCHSIIRSTEKGRANCYQSDAIIGCYNAAGPVMRPCLSGGLWDAGASISVDGKHIANWLIGQVRNEKVDEAQMICYADEIGANRTDFLEALYEVPVMSMDQFKKISEMLFLFANILSEKAYNNYRLKIQIAERKQGETALQISKEEYQLLAENASDVIWTMDLQGNYLYVSPSVFNMKGYTAEENMMQSFEQTLMPESVNIANRALKEASQKIMSGEKPESVTLVLEQTCKNGSTIWSEIIINAIYNDAQQFKYFLGVTRDINKRIKTEVALQESESQKAAILRVIPDLLFVFNTKGDYLEVYSGDDSKFSGSKASVIGKNIKDFFPPDITLRAIEAIRKSQQNKELVMLSYSMVVNGKNELYEARIVPTTEGNVLAIVRDITEQEQVKKALAMQNNALNKLNQFSIELSSLSLENDLEAIISMRIKEFTGASGVLFSSYDRENLTLTPKHIAMESKLLQKVIRLAGKKIEKFHSVISDELYQMMSTKIICPYRDLTEATFGTVSRTMGSMLQALLKADRFIGVTFLVEGEVYGTALLAMGKQEPDPPKEILENFLFLAAVSLRRKLAEEQLRLSQQTYRGILDSITEAVYIEDKKGLFLEVNQAAEKMYGYSKNEIVGQIPAFLSAQGKNDLVKIETILEKAYNGEPQSFEFWGRRKDGTIFPKDISTSRGYYFGKKVNISVARDVTEKKKIIEDLIKAKEHAEESDRLKSSFLANMSHEIRTPMNGILGFAGLLKEPNLSGEEQQEYISIIEKSGARMLNIINDIVSISKVESGQMEISLSTTDINDQIKYLYNFFKPEVEAKGMQLFIKNTLATKYAIIKTDKEKVYAIITNLVKNAIKFTQSGYIEFGYCLKSDCEPIMLEFFVKDTGMGIGNEQKNFIFERFRQGSESLTRNYEGAGLGLAISKAYVEMLGGKIWVESEKGNGSVFYFTIPYNGERIIQNVIKNVISMDVTANQMSPDVSGLKVLIAEDDEGSAMLIAMAIRGFSRETIKVKTGIEAVETCRNNPDIDLILMDIKMPEMDGFDATRQIRRFNKEVIIIAQTAYALTGDREKTLATGCNDYISKPIQKDQFMRLIQKYFKK